MSVDAGLAMDDSLGDGVATWPRAAAWTAVAVLVGAPSLQLASHLIEPTPQDTTARLTWISENATAATLAKSLDLVAVPVLLAVAVVYVLLSKQRSPRLSYMGGVLFATGLVGLAAVEGFETFAFVAVADGRFELSALADVGDNQFAGPGAVMMVMFLLPGFIGLLVLAAALWRSASVPRAAVVLLIAAFLIDVFVVEAGVAPHWIPHAVTLLSGLWIAGAIMRAR